MSEQSRNMSVVSVFMNSADTEYEFGLPASTKVFIIHSRNGNAVRMSHMKGLVAGSHDPYFTLKASTAYSQDDLDIQLGQIMYVACSIADEVLEALIGQ